MTCKECQTPMKFYKIIPFRVGTAEEFTREAFECPRCHLAAINFEGEQHGQIKYDSRRDYGQHEG